VSLYGVNRQPSPKELDDLDVLVYDIQDIGSRYYTYISSMAYMMDVAAQYNIPFIVLDRPNPLGRKISGPILDMEYASFVGMFPIPIRHGMTSGELALMINLEKWLPSGEEVDLSVIRISGWDMNPGYFSIAPSPNIPDYNTALVYNGMCLLEGTNISEGRGTDYPFLYFGAPWINGDTLTDTLNYLEFEGVSFESVNFTPIASERSMWPKYENEICSGCKIIITEGENYSPINTTIQIIYKITELYPERFEFLQTNFIDKLYGSNKLRKWVKSQDNLFDIHEDWETQFSSLREQYLIY
jgi:beta-N-acetylhexosaminidase